jgi:hypothetical protein
MTAPLKIAFIRNECAEGAVNHDAAQFTQNKP